MYTRVLARVRNSAFAKLKEKNSISKFTYFRELMTSGTDLDKGRAVDSNSGGERKQLMYTRTEKSWNWPIRKLPHVLHFGGSDEPRAKIHLYRYALYVHNIIMVYILSR